MAITQDLVVAESWKDALNAPNHRDKYPCEKDIAVNIDDLVILLTVVRGLTGDRDEWVKAQIELRKEVHSHEYEMKTRKVYVLGPNALDDIVRVDNRDLSTIATQWSEAVESNIEHPEEAIAALKRVQTIATEAGHFVFLKSFDTNNAFEQAFLELDKEEQDEYIEAFENWDAHQRFDAHLKYRELKRLGVDEDSMLGAVLEEVNEGSSHASTYAFLGYVAGSIQAIVDDQLYAFNEEEEAAIAKFADLMTEDEKKRVVGNISYQVMQAICECIEDEGDESPFRWSLVKVDEHGRFGPRINEELHAYLEDEWIYPKVDN